MANAGVVGMAEVVVPNSASSGTGMGTGSPAMWSCVWVGLSVLFLVFIHLALVGKASR
jgi:hypothetical protein